MKALNCNKPAVTDYLTQDRPTLSKGKAIIEFKWIAIGGTNLHTFESTQPYFNYQKTLGQEWSDIFNGARGFTYSESFPFIPYFNCGTWVTC